MDDSQTQVAQTGKICLACGKFFPGDAQTCPDDGSALVHDKPDPLIGTVFADKYEIMSVLGKGGMSIVYKARHMHMHRIVAVKLLLESVSRDSNAFKRFEQESRAASSLSHQNIVSVHDFGVTANGQAYFVMDCLEGDTLEDLIFRKGCVEPQHAIEIFRQVCDGLQHAHKKGVIHRDLKPSNIVLLKEDDGSETAKIVDFGIAKIGETNGSESSSPRLTTTGQVFGSPLYMSPEQCQGYSLDARSDIYSLGCLMYETLTATTPFCADSFFNMALMHLQQPPPPFSQTAPGANIPAQLEAVVRKCLEKNAADRFATAGDVKQKLLDAALLAGMPGYKPGAVPATAVRQQAGMRATWEKMKAVLDGQVVAEEKKSFSAKRLVATACGAMLSVAALLFFFFWQGAPGDGGTPFNKVKWQICLALGEHFLESREYDRADFFLSRANNLAQMFIDGHERLRITLDLQKHLFHEERLYDREQAAVAQTNAILQERLLADTSSVRGELEELMKVSIASDQERFRAQSHATAVVSQALDTCRGLFGGEYYPREEILLEDSLKVLDRLQLDRTEQMADVKSALAKVLTAEQRVDQVRALLADVVAIRKQLMRSGGDPACYRYVESVRKLGEYDRDQSNFTDAESELTEALKMARGMPHHKRLLRRCLASEADLARQLGDMDMYKQLDAQAQALSRQIVRPSDATFDNSKQGE